MRKSVCLFLVYFSLLYWIAPAQEGETTRKLWDTAFIDQPKRPQPHPQSGDTESQLPMFLRIEWLRTPSSE